MTVIDDDVAEIDELESAEPTPRRSRTGLRTATVATASVAALLALTGSGYQSWLLLAHHRSDTAAQQALGVARDYAVTLTTADSGTVDEQIGKIVTGSTGDFHDRYAKHSADLRAMLITNKVSTRGTVVDAAVKSAKPHQVQVLLVVKQTFTTSATPRPSAGQPADIPTDITAMAITLHKIDGRWLVSDVVPAQQDG